MTNGFNNKRRTVVWRGGSVDECLDAVVAIALGCWTFGLSGEE
jgi:hypothetical protein